MNPDVALRPPTTFAVIRPAVTAKPLGRCRCGTVRTDREATPEREYSFAGLCYLLWGGTSVPTRVCFRCVHCGDVFDACTDRATCRRYIM